MTTGTCTSVKAGNGQSPIKTIGSVNQTGKTPGKLRTVTGNMRIMVTTTSSTGLNMTGTNSCHLRMLSTQPSTATHGTGTCTTLMPGSATMATLTSTRRIGAQSGSEMTAFGSGIRAKMITTCTGLAMTGTPMRSHAQIAMTGPMT